MNSQFMSNNEELNVQYKFADERDYTIFSVAQSFIMSSILGFFIASIIIGCMSNILFKANCTQSNDECLDEQKEQKKNTTTAIILSVFCVLFTMLYVWHDRRRYVNVSNK